MEEKKGEEGLERGRDGGKRGRRDWSSGGMGGGR